MRPPGKPVIIVIAALLVGGAGGSVIALRGHDSGNDTPASRHVITSPIWHEGTRWTVTVNQSSSQLMANPIEGKVATQAYHFEVTKAPTNAKDPWIVHAVMDGAEGPFAAGYDLTYVTDPTGGFALKTVAMGGRHPVPPREATFVLGQGFPLDKRITKTPTNRMEDL